jgi:hypothetical protein
MSEIKTPCKWCGCTATLRDYREINGTTTPVASCDVCKHLTTEYLINRLAPTFEIIDNYVVVELVIQGEMFSFRFADADEWSGNEAYDVHYSEDYRSVCVYKVIVGQCLGSEIVEKYAIPEDIINR